MPISLDAILSYRPTFGAARTTPAQAPAANDILSYKPRFGAPAASPVSYKDPTWDASEQKASKVTGVPADVLRSIRVNGERSNGNQVSPKGARGVYQFIPSTRDAFKTKYNVDAYSTDPDEQALAAAHHLSESYKRTGDWSRAVAGYNGGVSGEKGTNRTTENSEYVKRVMPAIQAPQKLSAAEDYDDAWASEKFSAIDGDDDNQA